MRKFILILAAVWSAAALAADPKNRIRVTAGVVEVDAVFVAKDNCHRIINASPGAPAGQTVPEQAAAATVRIAREEGKCEQKSTPLVVSFALPGKEEPVSAVQIYYIDRDGNVISTQNIQAPR